MHTSIFASGADGVRAIDREQLSTSSSTRSTSVVVPHVVVAEQGRSRHATEPVAVAADDADEDSKRDDVLSSGSPFATSAVAHSVYARHDDKDLGSGVVDASVQPTAADDDGVARKRAPAPGTWAFVRRVIGFVVPYGGLLSCTFNLAAATLGAGIISLPSGFNLSGVIMSLVILFVLYVATVYSLHLLARVIIKTGLRTYADAAHHLLGRGADYFLATLMAILCFGGAVAYIIATGTLLTPVVQTPGAPAYLRTRGGNRVLTTLVWLCLMVPFVIPKRINSLRYFSGIGIVLITYFVVCMVVHACTHGMRDAATRQEMVMLRTGNAALEGLGVFMFSFMCQMNAFEIVHEMRDKTVKHFTLYSALSMGLCVVLYVLAGYFGYADFGRRVTDSVLTLYDPVREPYIAVGYVCIVVKICAAFTLHMQPFRDAIYYFFRWNAATLPYWKHTLVMMVPTTLALLCGLFVPTLNTVLGLLGSFCGGTIGLIMPALFFMYSGNFTRRDVGLGHYLATYALLIVGVIIVVFGTATTIYSIVGHSFA